MFKTRTIIIVIIFLFLSINLSASNIISRVAGSPYPFSNIPDTIYIVKDNAYSEAERFSTQTLQGLLAKEKPMIYRDRGVGYTLWLKDLINNYNIIVDSTYYSDFTGLITKFKNRIDGYILCDLHTNSSNVALSISGLLNAIAITPEYIDLMANLDKPQIDDVRGKDEDWALANYDSLFSTKIIIYQKEEKDLFLGDYTSFTNAFHFFDPIYSGLTTKAFRRMDKNSALFGWGNDEHQLVHKASENSIHVHPADWAVNISTLTNFTVDLKQTTHTDSFENQDDVHTVCFVMTDGDNLQWTLGDFVTSERWYGSPKRGKINLGWTISPAMCELSPTVMNYFYQTAANTDNGKDYFIAGPSGMGYIYPDQFSSLDSACSLLDRMMQKSDLNIVNIIGDNSNDNYLKPYLDQEHIDALFYYKYSNYSGLSGDIKWINDKPVIGGRYNLWNGFNTNSQLANKINRLSTDSYSEEGYSLIPVHAWSKNVDDVIECVSMLDSNVIIVTPDVFIKRIKEKLGNNTKINSTSNVGNNFQIDENYPNPFNNSTTIHYYLPKKSNVKLNVYNVAGKLVDTIVHKKQELGQYRVQWNPVNITSGLYFIRFEAEEFSKVTKCVLLK